MSLSQPIKHPVKVFLSTDKDAPQLNRQANELQVILKACLVTGYGDKQGAGWTIAFEDDKQGIKVLAPKMSAYSHFFLKLSNDTGRECTTQVYTDMTAIDNGTLQLQLDTPFKYGIQNVTTNKWAVIASEFGFWFFYETANHIKVSASYLYCGNIGQNTKGDNAVLLSHTGGTWGITDKDRYPIISQSPNFNGINKPKLLINHTKVADMTYTSLFDGIKNMSANTLITPIVALADDDVFVVPAFAPSRADKALFEQVQERYLCVTTSTHTRQNIYIPTDYWEL